MIPIAPFTSCSDPQYIFNRLLDDASIDIGQELLVAVSGGVSPYSWSVTGNAFDLESASTTTQYNTIRTNSNTIVGESVEEVTIIDACGTETEFFVKCCFSESCCDNPEYSFSVEDEVNVALSSTRVQGGCPPFTWEVFGELVTFEAAQTNSRVNYFNNDYNTDIYAVYRVTDYCGNSDWGELIGEEYEYDPDYFSGCGESVFCLPVYGYRQGMEINNIDCIYDSSPMIPNIRIAGYYAGGAWPYIDNNAIRLNGSNYIYSVSPNALDNRARMTIGQISFDFRLNSYGSFYLLNSYENTLNYDRIEMYASSASPGNCGAWIDTRDGDINYIHGVGWMALELNTWYHIDLVKDGSSGITWMRPYINWYSKSFTSAYGFDGDFYRDTGRNYLRFGEGLDGWLRNIKILNGWYENI